MRSAAHAAAALVETVGEDRRGAGTVGRGQDAGGLRVLVAKLGAKRRPDA